MYVLLLIIETNFGIFKINENALPITGRMFYLNSEDL